MSSSNLPPSLNLSASVKSATAKSTKGKKKSAPVVQFPNVVRADGTPNVGPPVVNTMEMSISKQKAALDKKELAAIQKSKCAEAHMALVRLLVPPTTHQAMLRVMPERELFALPHSQLAAQAARLMNSEDPHGKIACGGVAIHQCIIALSAVTQRLIDKILRDKEGELAAIDAVNEFMDLAGQRQNPDDDGDDNDDNRDSGSVPDSSDDGDDGSGSDSDDDDDDGEIQFIDGPGVFRLTSNTSSSSRLPSAVSALGVETAVGKEVVRDLGKRKSKNTPMLGEFHGKVHHHVLANIANPALKPPILHSSATEEFQDMQLTSDLHSEAMASTDVPPSGASDAPVPPHVDDISSTDSSDDDDDDGTRLFFDDNNGIGETQDDDAPVTARLPDRCCSRQVSRQ